MKLATQIWALFAETYQEWSRDKAARLGAALAFYAVFSLAPLLVVVMATAGLVFGQDATHHEIATALNAMLGEVAARSIDAMLSQAANPAQGAVALIIGGVTLLFGAVGVVVQLKDALNALWHVDDSRTRGWWRFTRTYLVSTAALLALAFLLVISLLLSAAIAAFGGIFLSDGAQILIEGFNFLTNLVVVSALFAMMFKWLPDVTLRWSDVMVGAVVTALLFTLGKFAIGYYLGRMHAETAFGASAAIVVILVWVYYAAQIVFLGAEFTRVYARRHGSLQSRAVVAPATDSAHIPAISAADAALVLASAWLRVRRDRRRTMAGTPRHTS